MIESPKISCDGAALSSMGIDTSNWYDATVPGTVLTTLVREGIYPDPYFGLNNLAIPESLNKQSFWYRTEFTLPTDFSGKELSLHFNGINYYAEIWLNGQYLGHITGAFIRGDFDVTRLAHAQTTNVLAVQIFPPPDPGIPSEQSVAFGPGDNGGATCLDGPTFVCSEGWDWIPAIRDRCAGIWQDVVLRATGPVTIADPQVITAVPVPNLTRAEVTIKTDLHNSTAAAQKGVLEASFEGVDLFQQVTLASGETKTITFNSSHFPQLTVENPRLWWPNGYGRPELYHLQLRFVSAAGTESDSQSLKFGIRQLSYELQARTGEGQRQRIEFTPTAAQAGSGLLINHSRSAMHWRENGREGPVDPVIDDAAKNSPAIQAEADDGMGRYLVIKVNGVRIFCLGGNWGMDDAMKNISREKMEPYIRLHRDANLTMIRNWSGQSTSETFYDLCDEYGILVWNDFWMDTETCNYVPVDHQLFLRNVADTIKRYRNHPSIAIWCAMNEGVPPDDINDGNDQLVRELDGTRYYQPNSRWVNLRTSGPWSNEHLSDYFTSLNSGFSTEIGASSIPSAEVMRSMMSKDDLWPPGDVWAYHDFHSKGAGSRTEILDAITRCYGAPRDLDDLCRKAQMVNYDTYRAIYEGFNSRMWNDCSGVLIWMSHPSWPSTVWQFYSWDYEPNAALFGAKKAAEPIHIQMTSPDCRIQVINHRRDPLLNATAKATLYNLQGSAEGVQSVVLQAKANSVTEAFVLNWPSEGAHFAKLELRDQNNTLLGENFYWHARDDQQLQELNTLAKADLQGNIVAVSNKVTLHLANASATPALAIRLTLRDPSTGERILPAYYEDDFFCLLSGEARTVEISSNRPIPERVVVTVDGWNIQPRTFDSSIDATAQK